MQTYAAAARTAFFPEWPAVVVMVVLLYVTIKLLANPRTRPFVIGLGALVGVGVLVLSFFLLVSYREVRVQDENAQSVTQSQQEQAQMIARQQTAEKIPSPPVPSPVKKSAGSENKRPKMTLIAALRQAVVQAWAAGNVPPATAEPKKPAEAGQPDVPAEPQRPAWVDAGPGWQDDCYMTSVWVGPFTTPLECERRLPTALQGAVAEYAGISFGPEAAAVRLPDDVLKLLVRERWSEHRPMEIDGGSQEMHSLHARIVFDAAVQQRIKSEAQRMVIDQRVKRAAVLFGGVLGLLGLAWGGLRLATRREHVKRT